jgi:hypothetical protein
MRAPRASACNKRTHCSTALPSGHSGRSRTRYGLLRASKPAGIPTARIAAPGIPYTHGTPRLLHIASTCIATPPRHPTAAPHLVPALTSSYIGMYRKRVPLHGRRRQPTTSLPPPVASESTRRPKTPFDAHAHGASMHINPQDAHAHQSTRRPCASRRFAYRHQLARAKTDRLRYRRCVTRASRAHARGAHGPRKRCIAMHVPA